MRLLSGSEWTGSATWSVDRRLVSTILYIAGFSDDFGAVVVFERDGVASICSAGCGGFRLRRVDPEETQNADHLEGLVDECGRIHEFGVSAGLFCEA